MKVTGVLKLLIGDLNLSSLKDSMTVSFWSELFTS